MGQAAIATGPVFHRSPFADHRSPITHYHSPFTAFTPHRSRLTHFALAMLIPSTRLLQLACAVALGGLAASLWTPAIPAWIVLALIALTIAILDAGLAQRQPTPAVLRLAPGSLPLGVGHDIALRLAHGGGRPLKVAIHDHTPPFCEVTGLPQVVAIPARGWAEICYRVTPVQRGDALFGRTELRIDSPLRLWQATRAAGETQRVRVYPNFAELTTFALLATDNRLSQIGMLQRRRRGEGLDFHQLREYREGDSQRQIDWKASARMQRLISRQYQDERDQQVVLMLDCGRRMSARDDALSHFDHAVNAALTLAAFAALTLSVLASKQSPGA